MKTAKKQSSKLKPHKIIKWVRTGDEQGLESTFEVICPHCNIKMLLRNSELLLLRKNAHGRAKVEPTVKVMYKCRPCAFVAWFYVGEPYVDNEYWNKVLALRDNHPLWVPPETLWSEDAIIQKRLKAIGYWGGDIDYGERTEIEEEK